ncbi:hypothetical protein T265_03110 [Opisthorchis viverrini]|uniref:SB domain-containing protein n=1 Tax=Opisthorchis viverrini TaxID=6198 RepID=A0A074ZTQ1_OPIVI|nr:hypothetical protein T265_03110 [Opisthorchis viverrini]KER30501.1 hypothetical protein T265_03110 [Opisthorchis viverrini]
MIRLTFYRFTLKDLQILYGTYVRLLLEYANRVVYSGRTKDATPVERVRRAATKMVAGLKSVDYETCLVVLDLFPLEYRRLRVDLILTQALFEQTLTVNRRLTEDDLDTCRALLKCETPSCEVRQLVADEFDPDVRRTYKNRLLESLPSAPPSDVNSYWDEIATSLHSAGNFACGTTQPGALKHWISDRTVALLKSRRNIPAGPEHNPMRRAIRRQVKKVKEMEEAQKAGNSRRLFQLIRATGPRKPPVNETIKHQNGTIISNKEERVDRWAKYFEQQLSWPPAGTHLEPTGEVEPWTPGSDLVGLLAVLQVTFGERPPVFSRLPAPSQPISAAPYPPSYPQVGFYPQPAPGRVEIGSGWQMPTSANMCTMPMPQMPNYNSPFPDSVGPTPNLPNPLPGNPYDPQKTEATGSLTEDQLLPSIKSAVADKIRREQQELIYQYNDELKAISQTQSELNDGRQKLRRMIEQMKEEQKTASENLEKLERENKELEELCANLDSAGEVDVDEAVFIEYPLYRQLVSSFAKEQAIEDAMYYLREALGKGVLDLDTYLERIRRLSKDQFELRSTVLLCRQEAGLPG